MNGITTAVLSITNGYADSLKAKIPPVNDYLTNSSHRAGEGVSQDHFGSLIHHIVLEITLGSHFRLRSHFAENSIYRGRLEFVYGNEYVPWYGRTRKYPDY